MLKQLFTLVSVNSATSTSVNNCIIDLVGTNRRRCPVDVTHNIIHIVSKIGQMYTLFPILPHFPDLLLPQGRGDGGGRAKGARPPKIFEAKKVPSFQSQGTLLLNEN